MATLGERKGLSKFSIAERDSAKFLDFAGSLPDLIRPSIRQYFRQNIASEQKPDQSPVTKLDREVEQMIRQAIRRHFPDHGIIGEEYGSEYSDRDFVWVIDPIDGTKAFLCGIPLFTSLVALIYQGQPILGMIDQAILGETWVAMVDNGCFFNRQPLPRRDKSPSPPLNTAKLFCTSPAMLVNQKLQQQFQTISQACSFVRYGCDAYGAAMIASSQGELMVEASLQFYDVAALVPIIQEIGGIVSDWNGKSIGLHNLASNPEGTFLAACHPNLHETCLSLLQSSSN